MRSTSRGSSKGACRSIKEVALDPEGSETGVTNDEEAYDRYARALEQGDSEAEDEALVDLIGAGMRKWWLDFPENRLLTNLYRRAAQRSAKCGSEDSRRPAIRPEALRIAKCLLADVQGLKLLDRDAEALAVTERMVLHWRSLPEPCRNPTLEYFIEESVDSRPCFDAVLIIAQIIAAGNERITWSLLRWSFQFGTRRRSRPPLPSIPAYRPVNSATLVRDVQIQFTLEILDRLGVRPRGKHVSGCDVVAEVLGISEHTVARIWEERILANPPEPVLRKYLEAVSDRTGLNYDAEA